MAKKATSKGARPKSAKKGGTKTSARAVARRSSGGAQDSMGEAFIKLLQSPLVADLVAVAATAALASLAEQGFSNRAGGGGSTGKRAGRAVKASWGSGYCGDRPPARHRDRGNPQGDQRS